MSAHRREPPPFRRAEVRRVERRTPRLARVTLAGPDLVGFSVEEPAASVRVLLPSPGTTDLVVPAWHGNEFLLPDGRRPAIRTLTPRRTDPDAGELDVEIVLHGAGVAAAWAEAAAPGDAAAVSGPARGYIVDPTASRFVLGGDETALPAICQLIEALPPAAHVDVHVEVAAPEARLPLPPHDGVAVAWHDPEPGEPPGTALASALLGVEVDAGTRVWVAGEAAAVQRVRRHLFTERGLPRSQATVRGYWKHGRGATDVAEP